MKLQRKIEITGLAIGMVLLGNGARADDPTQYDAYGTYVAQLQAELATTQAALTSCGSTDTACRSAALAQKETLNASIAAIGASHVLYPSDTLSTFKNYFSGIPARVQAIKDQYKVCKAGNDPTVIIQCQAIAKSQDDQLHADELNARRNNDILSDETVQKLKADLAACQATQAPVCAVTACAVDGTTTTPTVTVTPTASPTSTDPVPLDSTKTGTQKLSGGAL